jgi:hypothetical protein
LPLSAAWDSSSITYYLDGRPYHSVNASAVLLPTAPMHVIFDQVRARVCHARGCAARSARLMRRHQAVDPLLFPPRGDEGGVYGGDGVSMRVEWVRAYVQA